MIHVVLNALYNLTHTKTPPPIESATTKQTRRTLHMHVYVILTTINSVLVIHTYV